MDARVRLAVLHAVLEDDADQVHGKVRAQQEDALGSWRPQRGHGNVHNGTDVPGHLDVADIGGSVLLVPHHAHARDLGADGLVAGVRHDDGRGVFGQVYVDDCSIWWNFMCMFNACMLWRLGSGRIWGR